MNLTIYDNESGQPILVLSDDSGKIEVTGGDPQMVDQLGIAEMTDLKEIADSINVQDGELQAVFDQASASEQEDDREDEEGGEEAELDARIAPALEIIKELLDRAKARQAEESNEETDEQVAEAVGSGQAQVEQYTPKFLYVSMDGDNIGNAVARAEEQDDEGKLSEMSERIDAGLELFRNWATQCGGEIIEAGGDEGLAKVPDTALDLIEEFRANYFQVVGATVSVGVGLKISECTKARELAKLRGKDQTCVFDQNTEQELELRLEDTQQDEATKIKTAMGSQAAPEDKGNAPEPETSKDLKPGNPKWAGPPAEAIAREEDVTR